MRKLTDEMRETIQGSCLSLLTATMRTLDTEEMKIHAEVKNISVEYDLMKNEVKNLEKEVNKLRESINRPGTHALVLSAQVLESVRAECQGKEERLAEMHQELAVKKAMYDNANSRAKSALLFTLEQTSMASWSCFNILFHQLQRYFGDISKLSEPATRAMLEMKSVQNVAKAIDRDRKVMLKEAREEGERRAAQLGTPTGGLEATGTQGQRVSPNQKEKEEGSSSTTNRLRPFDDLFSDFIADSEAIGRGVAGGAGSSGGTVTGSSPMVQQKPPPTASPRYVDPATESSPPATKPSFDDLFADPPTQPQQPASRATAATVLPAGPSPAPTSTSAAAIGAYTTNYPPSATATHGGTSSTSYSNPSYAAQPQWGSWDAAAPSATAPTHTSAPSKPKVAHDETDFFA